MSSPGSSSSESSESNNEKKEQPQQTPSSLSLSSISSWFMSPSSLKERFEEFDDKQRLDRLSACQDLDRILNNCRERYQNDSQAQSQPANQYGHDPIESVSIGLRNMKYFEWRGILSSKQRETVQDDNDDDDNNKANVNVNNGPDLSVFHPKIRSSCAREQHAVWACRAVATGCGKDLSELKRCFEEVDNGKGAQSSSDDGLNLLPQHIRVLTAPYTNYEGIVEKVAAESADANANAASASLKQRIPCHEVQRRLGSCVTANGTQLLKRKQQRERQQQQ